MYVMKIIFFFCIVVSLVSTSILSNISKNRFGITYYSLKYLIRLFTESLDKGEKIHLIIFAIDILSTFLWIILFFVVF